MAWYLISINILSCTGVPPLTLQYRMSPSTASMAGSGSSRNLRGSARSGNNGSWKGNIRFKTTTEDKTGKRNSFFNAILQGHSIEGRDIPASWYTAVWDTQDNKLVA